MPPVATLLGLRLAVRPDVDDGTGVDNQFMAWLMADPVSGLAAARWQSGVGRCTVVRADGHDYTPDDHGILHDFMVGLLDRHADRPESAAESAESAAESAAESDLGGAAAIGEHISPRAFQRFVRRALGASAAPAVGSDRVSTVLFPRVQLHGLTANGGRLNDRIGSGDSVLFCRLGFSPFPRLTSRLCTPPLSLSLSLPLSLSARRSLRGVHHAYCLKIAC